LVFFQDQWHHRGVLRKAFKYVSKLKLFSLRKGAILIKVTSKHDEVFTAIIVLLLGEHPLHEVLALLNLFVPADEGLYI